MNKIQATNIKAYTDYYGAAEQITLLSYDDDKYVKVLRADGTEDEIKRGYIFKDELLTKRFSRRQWFVLAGNNLRDYCPYHKENGYYVDGRFFKTRKWAFRFASNLAKRNGTYVDINPTVTVYRGGEFSRSNYGRGCFLATASGDVLLPASLGGNANTKYMRGFGKIKQPR